MLKNSSFLNFKIPALRTRRPRSRLRCQPKYASGASSATKSAFEVLRRQPKSAGGGPRKAGLCINFKNISVCIPANERDQTF